MRCLESDLSLYANHRAGAADEGREADVASGVAGINDILLIKDVLAEDADLVIDLVGLAMPSEIEVAEAM